MKTIAIYHCWSLDHEPDPYKNLRTSVVPSIATLRSVSDIDIVVLDCSPERTHQWGYLQEKLNFQVVKTNFYLEQYSNSVKGYKHLSRIFDIHNWCKNQNYVGDMIYVDSDVFFFKNPLPLEKTRDRFCYDGWNTGYFYFNPNEEKYQQFFDLFKKYTIDAIQSKETRQSMKKYIGYDDWYEVWDEMVLGYMKNKHPDLFNLICSEEHTTSRNICQAKTDRVKVFHGNGSYVPSPTCDETHSRGLLCLMVQEFYENITKILSKQDLVAIFGGKNLSYFENKRFSLLDNVDYLEWIKNEKGHYELMKFTNGLHVI